MNASTLICSTSVDAAFGPIIAPTCRDGFDFTIVFEQSIFVILPASLLLLAAPVRLLILAKSSPMVHDRKLRGAKLVAASCLALIQLVLAILWATRGGPSARLNSISLAATCVSFTSSVMCCALSYFEHVKSPRPSSLLNVYLLVSLLLDCALVRSLWLTGNVDSAIQIVFTTAFALKLALLVLEGQSKKRYLVGSARSLSSEETSGLYVRAVMAWVLPLLRTGFQRLLQPGDLFSLDQEMRAETLRKRFWKQWEISTDSKHRLLWCCMSTLRWSIAIVVLPRLVLLAFTICQPLVLTRFLEFLEDAAQPNTIGYALVAAYGIVYFGIAVSQALYWHRNARTVSMLRSVLVTAVFSKLTVLNLTVASDEAAVTLMSSDVDVIVRAAKEIHEFWANLFQIAVGTWLLAREIGYAAAGPIVVAVVALIATLCISPRAMKSRIAWLAKTQKRVAITSSMIGHIKSIKISGLSATLASSITSLRKDEILASRPFRIIGSITSSIAQIPIFISPPVAFALFQIIATQTGVEFGAGRMFTALALITLQAQPLFWMFEAILDLSSALGAIQRIQKFLLAAERKEIASEDASEQNTRQGDEDSHAIVFQNASFGWKQGHYDLSDISFTVEPGQLALLVGPVASGKSTLLNGLLGEVPYALGRAWLGPGKIAWCTQRPWIVNQPIRSIILGYASYDEALYNRVIKCCELEYDLQNLQNGDLTVVGSKGFALSGGQQQRIALARALYSRPNIAILDDVFSGLDSQTARRVFQNLFSPSGLLRGWNTTVLLATQSVSFLPAADLIIALTRNGTIGEIGTFTHLSKNGSYVQSLFKDRETVIAVEAEVSEVARQENDTSSPVIAPAPAPAPAQTEDKRRQLGDSSVYKYYFGSIGKTFALTLLFLELGWTFLQSFPSVWLKLWLDSIARKEERNGYFLGIYSMLQVTGVIWFAILIWFVLVQIAAKSGISLHHRLLNTVLHAPMSLFATSDIGSITTRFSQDIGMIDNQLPLALVVTLASFFTVFAKAGLLAAASYYVAISFPILAVLYYYLQRAYLRTSRQLRFLDLEQKAPVYSLFLETSAGLSTIRAFGWTDAVLEMNDKMVDDSQKPFYLLIIVQKWLVLMLDLGTTALALLVVGFAVYLRNTVSVSLTGVSLVQLISMSETLNMLIQFWTSIETSIGAVARIKQFAEATPSEDQSEDHTQPPENWPNQGHLVIENLSASYDTNNEIKVLQNIGIEARPGEKIGICGRTGSGKSSLLLSIFRLIEHTTGSMVVDGVQLTSLSKEAIRRRLIAISQDQFVLPGSIRQNIDPENIYGTEEIERCLTALNLWESIEAKGGLDVEFKEDALSHGQKQLFFLARSILRKDSSKVVLLDEATSSLDSETEAQARRVIEDEFRNHTVISIAHRLDNILEFDRVYVLDNGRVIEVGNPRELLCLPSKFRALWNAGHSDHK